MIQLLSDFGVGPCVSRLQRYRLVLIFFREATRSGEEDGNVLYDSERQIGDDGDSQTEISETYQAHDDTM